MTAVLKSASDSTQLTLDDFALYGGYRHLDNGLFSTCWVIESDKAWERLYPSIARGELYVTPATFIPPTGKTKQGAWSTTMLTYSSGRYEPTFLSEEGEELTFIVERDFKREDRQRGHEVDWKAPESVKRFLLRVESYIHCLDLVGMTTDSGLCYALYDPETGACWHDEEEELSWRVRDLGKDGDSSVLADGTLRPILTQGIIAFSLRGGERRVFTADELNIG